MITIIDKSPQVKLSSYELKTGEFYVVLNGEYEGKLIYCSSNTGLPTINVLAEGTALSVWFCADTKKAANIFFAPVDVEINFEIQKNPE